MTILKPSTHVMMVLVWNELTHQELCSCVPLLIATDVEHKGSCYERAARTGFVVPSSACMKSHLSFSLIWELINKFQKTALLISVCASCAATERTDVLFSSLSLQHSQGWKQGGAPVPCLLAALHASVMSAPWKWIERTTVWFRIKF